MYLLGTDIKVTYACKKCEEKFSAQQTSALEENLICCKWWQGQLCWKSWTEDILTMTNTSWEVHPGLCSKVTGNMDSMSSPFRSPWLILPFSDPAMLMWPILPCDSPCCTAATARLRQLHHVMPLEGLELLLTWIWSWQYGAGDNVLPSRPTVVVWLLVIPKRGPVLP